MAKNDKLYITITDNREGGDGKPTNHPKEEEKKDDVFGRYLEHQMFHLVKNQTTRFVNFTVGNIGNLTGNYIAQRQANEAKQAISNIMSIAMTTLAGAKYGVPGAIVGFVVGVTSVISNATYDMISDDVENKKANHDIKLLRERAGLNTVLDGSRGTEN